MSPEHYNRKLRRAGVPVPVQPRTAVGGRPRKDGPRLPCGLLRKPPTGNPIGRPLSGLHRRSAYWRQWKRSRSARLADKPADNEDPFT